MELMKIFLILTFWPAGTPEEAPKWTSDAFLTVEACQAAAAEQTRIVREKYGAGTKVAFQCLSLDDRVAE
ncbi:hypothetical protein [Sphingorhabdus sp. Alg239-R122]|uniref:hypothetical protein n=1 Tax=Sphingorhabdus sp. Alg239-R122 TaxID=2305989 RepID=UPI0013DB0E3B|nr:hypothetical protein [Sphingorhabdus sp. Alg239-R122]